MFVPENVNIFLSSSFNINVLGAQKNRFIEYAQHMFGLRNMKKFIWYALFTKGLLYPFSSQEPRLYSNHVPIVPVLVESWSGQVNSGPW